MQPNVTDVLAIHGNALPSITPESLEKLLAFEQKVMEQPQLHFQTEHVIHAGMYARTVRLAPGTLIVGVLIKVPTILVVHGKALVFAGEKWYRIADYQVIPASANRKQVFFAIEMTELTMIFPSEAETVRQAEDEFTDEVEKLVSRRDGDDDLILITGVKACRV